MKIKMCLIGMLLALVAGCEPYESFRHTQSVEDEIHVEKLSHCKYYGLVCEKREYRGPNAEEDALRANRDMLAKYGK